MSDRTVTTNRDMHPCPKCGNKRNFKIVSQQVAEDGCEVWAECVCGYSPSDGQFESVMGGCGPENTHFALRLWNSNNESERG